MLLNRCTGSLTTLEPGLCPQGVHAEVVDLTLCEQRKPRNSSKPWLRRNTGSHVFTPPGSGDWVLVQTGNVLDTHPLGVFYNAVQGKWQIFHQDIAPMTTNAAYNVLVVKP